MELTIEINCFGIRCIRYFHIDYNAPKLTPKVLHNYWILLGTRYYGGPKRNQTQWLCKMLGGKQGAFWSMRKW